MNDLTTSALDAAREALHQCTALLQSDTPEWDAVHAALGTAQRALAVAEFIDSQKEPEPLPPPPVEEPPIIEEPEIEQPVIEEAEIEQPFIEPTLPVEPVFETPVEEPQQEATAEVQPLPAAGASLAERLSEQPLENLKANLSINNRVRFASLLTDGDVPALMELCDALERSAHFEAAQVLLLETAGDVNWEDEESGAAEFLSLVRRLFAGK